MDTLANNILYQLHEEQFKKVTELLIEKTKEEKDSTISTISKLCLDVFIPDDEIIKERNRLKKLDELLSKLTYDKCCIFEINMDEFLDIINERNFADRSTLESEIKQLLSE